MNHPLPARADTVILARWLIPIEPANTVLDHHALIIDNGNIVAIAPIQQALQVHADRVFELPDHAVLPGLINAHGHAAMSLLRGYADDFPLHSWLNDHIWPA